MTKTTNNRRIILPIITTLLLIILSTVNWAQASPQQQERSGAPTIVSYQGNIWEGDEPYDGTGYFKFAVVDPGGTTTYWSNDGSSTGGAEPTASINLGVENGLFSILLGDTSLPHMTSALDEQVFGNPDTHLRIWFSDDENTAFIQLPDQKIASVPYALHAQYAVDADTLDGVQGSGYQLQVTGSCPVGQAVRAVNANGSVECEAVEQPSKFSLTTIDAGGIVGNYSSIAIGMDGFGLISYFDQTNYDLKVAHCENVNCTSVTTSTLDSTGSVGYDTSIVIGTDGFGLISYNLGSVDDLKVAHCNNTACSTATLYTLDSSPNTGWQTSIAIGADGLGLISYWNYGQGDLMVAHCNNTACSTATLYNLDSTINVGSYSSIAIGTDGLGLISYHDETNDNLKVAHCNNTACSTATSYILDSTDEVGTYTSLAIGADGLGLISYYDKTNYDLKVAHCDNTNCSTATAYTLDSTGIVGFYSSITIGVDGLGLISYYDSTMGDLKVAHCNNFLCTNATLNDLDSSIDDVGRSTSIAIGNDGYALISYWNFSKYDLKVAHCSNELCIPINWEH